MGQRVVDVEPLTIETTFSASGTSRNASNENVSFVGSPTTSEGGISW